MPEQNKSNDLMGVFKDIWQTGTQELGKNVGSMLASTPPNQSTGGVSPKGSSGQISISQEKREKDIIENRRTIR